MKKIYQQVSGDAVSEKAISLSSVNLISSDMFLVSTPALEHRKLPSGCQNLPGNVLKSAKSSYDSILSQIYDQFMFDLGLKRMAWEDETHYSLVNHIHNYSKFEITPLCVQTESEPDVKLSALADFVVDGRKSTVNMPYITTYKVPEPYIGQLRFMALDILPECPNDEQFYASGYFDGWVYADGRCLKKSSFPSAYGYFGDMYGSGCAENEFSIPDFRRFISMESDFKSDSSLVSHIPETNVLKYHNHTISNLSLNGTADLSVQFFKANNTRPGTACHAASSNSSDRHYNYDIYMKTKGVQCMGSNIKSAGDNLATYPNHTLLPVLIYIGKYGA